MKKFLLLASVLSLVLCSQAQVSLISPTYGNTKDTVTNTAAKVLWLKVIGYKESITATVNITKISGTLAGTLIPIVSNDGVNFYNGTGYTLSDSAITVTDVAAQGKAFQFKRGYQYYGVQWTGSGTMSGSFTGKLLARKSTD